MKIIKYSLLLMLFSTSGAFAQELTLEEASDCLEKSNSRRSNLIALGYSSEAADLSSQAYYDGCVYAKKRKKQNAEAKETATISPTR